jgi:hypothetical protein
MKNANYAPINITNGGSLSLGSLSIVFSNNTGAACTITAVQGNLFPVPQTIGTGLITVTLLHSPQAGDYSYHPVCGGQHTDPVIKVEP